MTTARVPRTNGHIQVLVVEDNRIFTELVLLQLAAAKDVNFDVSIAASADEGLRRLQYPGLDVILLDLHLPNGEGLSMVNRFIAAAGPDIPVIVTSANDDPQAAAEILAAGAVEFIAKPGYDSANLVPTIKAVVARHRAVKRVERVTEEVNTMMHEVQETLDALKDIAPKLPAAVAGGHHGGT